MSEQSKRLCALQDWVQGLPIMQQTVLLTAIRGPDGSPKYGATKNLLRWYRRCILVSALDGRPLTNPFDPGGGSFTGPSFDLDAIRYVVAGERNKNAVEPESTVLWCAADISHDDVSEWLLAAGDWTSRLDHIVDAYLRDLDMLPHHFQLHFLHSAEIVGYKHPDPRIRAWWAGLYVRLVHDMHLFPETEAQLDARLGDSREGWLERADPATVE